MNYLKYMMMCVAARLYRPQLLPRISLYLQVVVPLKQQKIEQIYEPIGHLTRRRPVGYYGELTGNRKRHCLLYANGDFQLGTTGVSSGGPGRVLGYLVDKNGDIDFPILGKIHADRVNPYATD